MKDKEAILHDIIACDIYHYNHSMSENGTKLSKERDMSQMISR